MIKKSLRYMIAVAAALLTVAMFLPFVRYLDDRPGTVGFALLALTVLLTLKWGAQVAIGASFAGILAWQLLFLRHDPQIEASTLWVGNVMLITSFAAVSLLVSWLSERTRLEKSANVENASSGPETDDEVNISALRTKRFFELTPDPLIIIDCDGQIHLANEHAEKLFHVAHGELEKTSVDDLLPERHRAEQHRRRKRYFENPESHEWEAGVEICMRRRDGKEFPVECSVRPLRTSDGVLAIVAFRDASVRKQTEKHILYLAQHDGLTGLPNRTTFCEYMTHAIAHARREHEELAVLFIDLDGFKDINDSHGHTVGDRILTMAANRMRDCVRECDYVGRHGGDEFVIGLTGLTDSNAGGTVTAKKIIDRMREPFLLDNHNLRLSASVGISRFPNDGDDIGSLLHAADAAMYRVKATGRDGFRFYSPRMHDSAHGRLSIVHSLKAALRQGELTLCYQPQVDLRHHCISSAEALIRWHKPGDGLIPARELIRIAEDVGFITELSEWTLRTACQQLKHWRAQGFPELRMAINLSPQQLMQPEFAELVGARLRDAALPANALDIEVTEHAMATQRGVRAPALKRLADTGARLIVDDFGTGHSSLSYLRLFPIKVVKIDRSFIHGIGRDANDTTFVSTIVTLAHNLNLEVAAEGVETAEQENFLTARDCFLAQGYRYSEAVKPDKFLHLLRGDTLFADIKHAGACGTKHLSANSRPVRA